MPQARNVGEAVPWASRESGAGARERSFRQRPAGTRRPPSPRSISAVYRERGHGELGSPLLTERQLAVVVEETKTPPPLVPAKTFAPVVATACTTLFVKRCDGGPGSPGAARAEDAADDGPPAKIGPPPGEFAASGAVTWLFESPVSLAHQATPSVE